jgi:catechol 2,3-dioxygenase-like lactoylglutathione lyase family enzyme
VQPHLFAIHFFFRENDPQEDSSMKRFHVHVAVSDLDRSIGFYSTLFGAAPTVRKPDYAKWMLDDPRINFAISKRSENLGVNHLGMQVESKDELETMHSQLQRADHGLVEEMRAQCCYAQSDKYWIADPQGVAWETFHSPGEIPIYGDDAGTAKKAAACCTPEVQPKLAATCLFG